MPPNDDILGEILIRLPAESLIRSRAVCKSWRAIIDAPPFDRAHQHQPINKSIIIIQTDPTSFFSLDLQALSFSSKGHQTMDATPLDFSGVFSPRSAVGACKGLFLTKKPLRIRNPLTQERLLLDLPPGGGSKSIFGLGYDYVTDDYKAVSILTTKPHQTDVYSLKSDSWRTITNCPRGLQGSGVFVCGALNWLSSKADDNKIIALDLGTEKYTLLKMPSSRRDYQFTVLDVLSGCLILCDSSNRAQLDVWVMKDYRDEGSWIVLLSIDQWGSYCGRLSPVGFIMRKEKEEDKMRLQVFLEKDCNSFFLFDVKTNTRKRVIFQGHNLVLYSQQMFPGTKFCLHDNCGGGGAKPKTSSVISNNNSSDLVQRFVFSLQDIGNE